MCVTTKNNVMILFELVLIKSNHIYAEIKYKSESQLKEVEFEKFLTLILSDCEEQNVEVQACR
jgi:hypothetical protein